ncbi:hypothetical protein KKC59_02450 [bacterium]|nr:hypothetical protein [bacterium]
MKKLLCSLGVFAMLVLGSFVKADAAVLLVDDFDDNAKPNLLGGDFGAWDKDPNDTTQGCTDAFDGDIKYGTSGYSLKLDYDVDSPNPAYNGFWMSLSNSDLRQYNSLVFYVKGDEGDGYTTQCKIELKNNSGEVGRYLVVGISDKWKKVVVPFRKVTGLTDWSNVTELVVVFDDVNSTDKDGVIYMDSISFETL